MNLGRWCDQRLQPYVIHGLEYVGLQRPYDDKQALDLRWTPSPLHFGLMKLKNTPGVFFFSTRGASTLTSATFTSESASRAIMPALMFSLTTVEGMLAPRRCLQLPIF